MRFQTGQQHLFICEGCKAWSSAADNPCEAVILAMRDGFTIGNGSDQRPDLCRECSEAVFELVLDAEVVGAMNEAYQRYRLN